MNLSSVLCKKGDTLTFIRLFMYLRIFCFPHCCHVEASLYASLQGRPILVFLGWFHLTYKREIMMLFLNLPSALVCVILSHCTSVSDVNPIICYWLNNCICIYIFSKFYLKGWVTEMERQKSFIHPLVYLPNDGTRSRPRWSQKPGIPFGSPTWMIGTQVHGPFSAAFPGTLAAG